MAWAPAHAHVNVNVTERLQTRNFKSRSRRWKWIWKIIEVVYKCQSRCHKNKLGGRRARTRAGRSTGHVLRQGEQVGDQFGALVRGMVLQENCRHDLEVKPSLESLYFLYFRVLTLALSLEEIETTKSLKSNLPHAHESWSMIMIHGLWFMIVYFKSTWKWWPFMIDDEWWQWFCR